MKAILVRVAGGPEVLQPAELPLAEPAPGEVRVRVAAIGLNYADVMCRRGRHASMRPPPLVPGCEAAGTVEACGPGVVQHRVGDRVGVYSPFGGAYAEALVVPEAYALPLPAAMSFDEAAAFTHLALTAWQALHGSGEVRAGMSLLVTAAAGGLGGMLLQLGAAAGLAPLAATGSAAKAELLRARGVDCVVDYESEPLTERVLAATGGRGADIVVETVGGALYRAAESSLAPLGRIVIAGAAGGTLASPDAAALLARSAQCVTLNLSVVYAQRPAAMRTAWSTLCSLWSAGALKPRIGRRFALAEAAAAHHWLESRASTDKILLNPPVPDGTSLA